MMVYKHLDSVTRMLEFLEKNIDEAHCEEVEKRHLDALHFKPGAVLPLAIVTKPEEELLPRDEAFNNPEVTLHNELLESEPFLGNIMNSVYTKDDFPFHIRSSHGLALTHSILGGKYQVNQKALPWTLPLDIPIAEYRRQWEDKPYDTMENEVVKKVLETYSYFKERLAEYPKCRRRIKLSHPNLNDPFQAAQLLIGSDFFLELYDNPEDVHWLIKRVTETYIELFKMVDPLMDNQTSDKSALYIHGGIYPCRTILKNDTAVAMLSEEHYLEFSRPYYVMVAEALGEICIHYCGRSLPFHPGAMNMPGLKGLNYGDPQMQDIGTVINEWNKKQIAIVGWGHEHPPEFLYESLHGKNVTGFTLDCTMLDREKAAEYVKSYREKGIEGLKPAG
jgi:hypothetical protein